jgi:hypothetical protein
VWLFREKVILTPTLFSSAKHRGSMKLRQADHAAQGVLGEKIPVKTEHGNVIERNGKRYFIEAV